jgi:hypothetical protein
VGVGIDEDDEGGDEVTVVLAAEKFAPVQYHSFDVGPFMVKTTRRPGETLREVRARVMPELCAQQEAEFNERLPLHLARVRSAATAARGAGR